LALGGVTPGLKFTKGKIDLLTAQAFHPAKFHRPVSIHAGDICYKISADKQTQKQ